MGNKQEDIIVTVTEMQSINLDNAKYMLIGGLIEKFTSLTRKHPEDFKPGHKLLGHFMEDVEDIKDKKVLIELYKNYSKTLDDMEQSALMKNDTEKQEDIQPVEQKPFKWTKEAILDTNILINSDQAMHKWLTGDN